MTQCRGRGLHGNGVSVTSLPKGNMGNPIIGGGGAVCGPGAVFAAVLEIGLRLTISLCLEY